MKEKNTFANQYSTHVREANEIFKSILRSVSFFLSGPIYIIYLSGKSGRGGTH